MKGLMIRVSVFENVLAFEDGADPIAEYTMNHDADDERRILGRQCRSAFEAGQLVVTYPAASEEEIAW